MRAISMIFRREMGAYLKSPLGYVIGAAALFTHGLLFYSDTKGLGSSQPMLSADVLSRFFYVGSGTTMFAAVLLTMRLIADERQRGTLVLLNTSPVHERDIIIGKYLSALVFLSGVTLLTFYMPLLIMVRGKISLSHVLVGYSGLLLLGAAVLAIGMFATALAPEQIVAGVVGGIITAALVAAYPLAKGLEPPIAGVFENLSLHYEHFWPFQKGILHLKNVVYYLAVTYFFLLLATKTLEAKRWQ